MDEVAGDAPLASFEAKWAQAHPEFRLALDFITPAMRPARSAFACLVYEIEHAAFDIREAQPATLKLQWWAEEFARAARREARHPLTRVLADIPAFADIPPARWYEVVAGALAQRDPDPAADRAALLDGYAALYRPLAAIETALFADADAEPLARARTLSRVLRETAALDDALRDGRLPLPLDLLARHRLSRGDLARSSPQQAAALAEWLRAIERDFAELLAARPRLGVPVAISSHADRWRARISASAAEPQAALQGAFERLPLGAAWTAWRAARRSRA